MRAYDPHAMEATQAIYGVRNDLLLCGTKEAALSGADVLVVCTEWKPFWSPGFSEIKAALTYPVIFDGRNLYDPRRLQDQGLQYFAIGRQNQLELSSSAAGQGNRSTASPGESKEGLKTEDAILS